MSDDLWDVYAGAIIECEAGGEVRCLRGRDAPDLPGPPPIFVLTAYNPAGVDRDRERNEADEAVLQAELATSGIRFWPATGRSRDASWSEPGVAVVGLDRTAACELGNRYGQLAVFELTNDEARVVRCTDEEVVRAHPRRG